MPRQAYARRELRRRVRDFLRANVWQLTAVALITIASIVSSAVLGGADYTSGFLAGLMVGLVLAGLGVLFLLHTGGLNQVAGMFGESRTDDELKRARRKGYVWGSVANIELPGGDIDRVVVAPGAVLAVEVKWSTRALDRRWLPRDLEQARRGAAKVRSILRSRDTVGEVHDVIPVLVLWGRAGLDVEVGGEVLDGVHVVDGTELLDWLRTYETGPIAEDNAERTLAALRRFAALHAPALGS